ncbi:MAG: SMI1/KNR4 family protein [Janthinobacterium lividum]
MQKLDWNVLLTAINQEIMSDERFLTGNYAVTLTDTQRQTKWLGQPGASEMELAQLEQRLQRQLPPSYRKFLATSNGFGPIDYSIYNLSPIEEVDWLTAKDSHTVELWEGNPTPIDYPDLADELYLRYDGTQIEGILRPGHMRQCLMIADWCDAGFVALNPAVQHEGEWEAWHFANWYPGAVRYRSFAEMMQSRYEEHKDMRLNK